MQNFLFTPVHGYRNRVVQRILQSPNERNDALVFFLVKYRQYKAYFLSPTNLFALPVVVESHEPFVFVSWIQLSTRGAEVAAQRRASIRQKVGAFVVCRFRTFVAIVANLSNWCSRTGAATVGRWGGEGDDHTGRRFGSGGHSGRKHAKDGKEYNPGVYMHFFFFFFLFLFFFFLLVFVVGCIAHG